MSKYTDPQGQPITPVILVDPAGNLGLVAPATTGVITNISVTNTATALPTNALGNRKDVRIWNAGNITVYVGYSNAVTAGTAVAAGAQGVPVAAGTAVSFGVSSTLTLFGIVSSGTCVVQVEEVA